MRENFKRRLDSIQEIVCPAKEKKLSECSREELVEIILDGCRETGKDGRPLTAKDLTDEKLMKIAMGGTA